MFKLKKNVFIFTAFVIGYYPALAVEQNLGDVSKSKEELESAKAEELAQVQHLIKASLDAMEEYVKNFIKLNPICNKSFLFIEPNRELLRLKKQFSNSFDSIFEESSEIVKKLGINNVDKLKKELETKLEKIYNEALKTHSVHKTDSRFKETVQEDSKAKALKAAMLLGLFSRMQSLLVRQNLNNDAAQFMLFGYLSEREMSGFEFPGLRELKNKKLTSAEQENIKQTFTNMLGNIRKVSALSEELKSLQKEVLNAEKLRESEINSESVVAIPASVHKELENDAETIGKTAMSLAMLEKINSVIG